MTLNLLSRDQILGASDIQTEDIEAPEWGGTVRVRGLTAKQRDEYESSLVVTEGKGKSQTQRINMRNARARLAVMAVIDEDGNPLFADSDVFVLGEKSGAVIDRIFEAASRLSGISETDMDELTGNSSGQSDDSNSD